MPASPQKKTNLNPIGVVGVTLFGGLTMILTMLAILFFPLAGVLGVLWDIVTEINPFKKQKEDGATQENDHTDETLKKS